MRHTVHIMLGKNAEQVLCDIKKYIIKYGSKVENDYFNAMLYAEDEDSSMMYNAQAEESDESTFVSGIDNMFNVSLHDFYEIPNKNRTEYLQGCFTTLYDQRITINNPGDATQLHVCLYVPLYEKKYWDIAQELIQAMDKVPQEYHVDLFMLPYDLAFLIEDDVEELPVKMNAYQKQTQLTVQSILETKKKYKSLGHLIMMQNCNNQGLSLDLDEDSFVRILGEYALLSVSNYPDIFNISAQDSKRPIHALGLSVLSFDKIYFVQYLLHQAYVHILDREKVLQEEVDVNKVSQIVQNVLSKNVKVFSSFYDEHIKTRLDKHLDQDSIIAAIHPELVKEIERLTNEFQSYIDSPELSLPEKKATLAQLLGEDDELLTGYMFNKKQLVIDDCSREVLDFFVQENNELFKMHESVTKEDNEQEILRKSQVNAIAENAVLSENIGILQEMPSVILDSLKDVKIRMREASNYIRLKSMELEDVNIQAEEHIKAQKRLTDKGFVFEGHTYHLQGDVDERPCEEDYEPIENHTPKVDLRQYFTSVKDQGELGACSSFALVGIFEYILKKNKALETDLSEGFVYHNAHNMESNDQNEGTSLYTNILALTQQGVCLEHFYPYSDKSTNEEPSEDAKNDALLRLVKKAKNVQKNISHIKSAIYQGYPVAVSIKVFDSFEPQFGFIPRPSALEIADGKSGNHAMVLCGYSDEEKFFIARNSWGTKFGDKGYCYIPYSYIEDFMNVACVITEINMENIRVAGNDCKTTVSFDMTNSKIKTAILQNLIEEEKRSLNALNSELQRIEFAYNQIFQTLGNNGIRTTIYEGSIARLEYEKTKLSEDKSKLEPERVEALNLFDKETKWGRHWFACSWLTFLSVFIALLCGTGLEPAQVLLNWGSYSAYIIATLGTIIFILWHWRRHRGRVDLDEDYQSRIEQYSRDVLHHEQELEIKKLKSHVAGMIIDSLAKLFRNLHSKYNGMNSYVGNLHTWREEETNAMVMSDMVREPFLSLVSNKCLGKYFEDCKDKITEKIKLFTMFRHSYQVDEEQIIRFKNNLKQTLVDELFAKLNDFSLYDHITGIVKYPYVERDYTDIDNLLQLMDKKSCHFVRTLSTVDTVASQNAQCKLLFVDTDVEATRKQWNAICSRNFQTAPSCYRRESPFKMTLLQMDGLSVDEIAILK